MNYFDISYISDDLSKLASRLGYKKIFTIGKEIHLVEKESEVKENSIIRGVDAAKLLKYGKVIGVIADKVDEATIQKIKSQEKILIIDASAIIRSTDESQMLQNIRRTRKIISYAMRVKVNLAMASFARDINGLTSAEQMIEVAKFLGAEEMRAKQMLQQFGAIK
jgi:hypothetical protein